MVLYSRGVVCHSLSGEERRKRAKEMPFCVIPSIFDVVRQVETLRPVLLVAPTGSQSFSLSTSQECASISSIPQNRAGTENIEIRGCLLHAAVARFLVGILKLDREERGTFHNAFEKGICIMFLTAGALLILLAAVQVGNRCVGSRSGVCGGGTWSDELALFDSVCGDRLHLFPSTLPRYLVVGLY